MATKLQVYVQQRPAMLSFARVYASMQVVGGGYVLTLTYLLTTDKGARGRWGGSLYSSGTGNKLHEYSSARARGLVRSFFEGRPISVL